MTMTDRHLTFDPDLEDCLDALDVRYEVIDGEFIVNSGASWDHEGVTIAIAAALHAAAPDDLVVMGSNLAYAYTPGSYVLPDVSVRRRADRSVDGRHALPLLVVEVLSPTTRGRDVGRTREIYRDAGVPSYWLVDPAALELTVLALVEGEYLQTQQLSGQGELTVDVPFPVVVRPFG